MCEVIICKECGTSGVKRTPPFDLLYRINHAVAAVSHRLDYLQLQPPVKDGHKTEVGFYQLSANIPLFLFSSSSSSFPTRLSSVCLSKRKRGDEMGQWDTAADFFLKVRGGQRNKRKKENRESHFGIQSAKLGHNLSFLFFKSIGHCLSLSLSLWPGYI